MDVSFQAQQVIENINYVIFWLAVFLLAWNAYFLAFNKGVPNIRTAPAIRNRIIDILKKDSEKRGKKTYTIIDLGSGNGLLTREIARQLPHAQVTGIETSQTAFAWSVKMRDTCKIKNLDYKRADFFTYDMSEVDAVVMFQGVHFMEKIGQMLHKNLKKGTLIASNKFALGDGWKPLETINVRTLYPFQKKLYIYYK